MTGRREPRDGRPPVRPLRPRREAAPPPTVLDQLGLADAADRLVRSYSGGMRRRLDLGASLVGAPALLLLDEPTTGLDPRSRIELWEAIRELVADGTDVLLTTQYLDEADQLADQIVIIDHGRVIADGTPGELKARRGRDVIEVHPARGDQADADRRRARRRHRRRHRTSTPTPAASRSPRRRRHRRPRAPPSAPSTAPASTSTTSALRRPTLDEVFLALTGHDTTKEPAR